MPNYYEIIKVQPSATLSEIEAAIEVQYNQWRRLVTHHVPNVASQATQALQILEQIRATLTHPDKRAGYDTAIGLSGASSGLADPEALLKNYGLPGALTPPSNMGGQKAVSSQASTRDEPGLWSCPKCKTENPEKSEHCFKCGTQLLRVCPECNGMTSLLSTGVCGKCGYAFDLAVQRQELREQINYLSNKVNTLTASLNDKRLHKWGCVALINFLILMISVFAVINISLVGGTTPGYLWGITIISFVILIILGTSNNKEEKNRVLETKQLLEQHQQKLTKAQNAYNALAKS